MLRGFLSGIFWGAIMVMIVAGFASLLAPLPATVEPQLSAAETTTGSDKEDSGDIGETSQADDAVGESNSGPAVKPGADDAVPLADTASAPQPNPDVPAVAMQAPSAGDAPTDMTSGSDDSPVAVDPNAPAPDAPEAPELTPDSITTNPAQPATPVTTQSGAFAPSASEDAQEVVAEPVIEDGLQEDGAQPAVTTSGASETEQLQEPEQAPGVDADVTPSAEADETLGTNESLLKPSSDLKETFPQLSSSRLPTVAAETKEQPTPVQPQLSRPFDVNAIGFEADQERPLMSIVLIDDSAAGIAPETLRDFPYPLSIAIDTLDPNRADRVARYQAMGFEILAMIDMPAAAAPSDVEVALDVHLSVMPQAVGVMEGVGDGLQGSKPLSDQVTAVLKDSGHGLLLFSKGLNTAQKLASREGVPAASVFRDFDSKGQSASVIRRFLDQAAFKADQEGGVIMLGRLREETLEALLVWGLLDRASSVALAPVSAVISAKQP